MSEGVTNLSNPYTAQDLETVYSCLGTFVLGLSCLGTTPLVYIQGAPYSVSNVAIKPITGPHLS
jgi:hypothetical protein